MTFHELVQLRRLHLRRGFSCQRCPTLLTRYMAFPATVFESVRSSAWTRSVLAYSDCHLGVD